VLLCIIRAHAPFEGSWRPGSAPRRPTRCAVRSIMASRINNTTHLSHTRHTCTFLYVCLCTIREPRTFQRGTRRRGSVIQHQPIALGTEPLLWGYHNTTYLSYTRHILTFLYVRLCTIIGHAPSNPLRCAVASKAFALTRYRALTWYCSPARPFDRPDVPLLVTGQQGSPPPGCLQLSRARHACAGSSIEESTKLGHGTELGRTLCYGEKSNTHHLFTSHPFE